MSGVFGPGRPRDRHTRACGSEWSISKPARALRALRHPPRWLPVVLVFGRRALVCRDSRLWCGACVSGAFGPGRPRDRHTRACGSEWSISKPARALRALRHPPRWLPVVLVFGRRALVCRDSRLWCGACVSGAFGPGRPRDRHTRACGSEWSISKPARALRALRHPPRWLPVVLVPGQALPHQNPRVRP